MPESLTFDDVSAATWERIKAIGREQHGTVFDPPDAAEGTGTTATPIGTIVIAYAFEPEARRLSYSIKDKPFLVPKSLIWDGIARTVDECRGAG